MSFFIISLLTHKDTIVSALYSQTHFLYARQKGMNPGSEERKSIILSGHLPLVVIIEGFFYIFIQFRHFTCIYHYLTLPDELEFEFEFEKVICTDLLLRDMKYLFYIIFCDFNLCDPELTAEYRRN